MKDKDKTHKQLITELIQLRQRIAEMEASERERKQVEEDLKRSEQEKTAIFDSISEHVVHQDTRMRVLWANRAAGESVGADSQQLVGRHCYEIWQQRSKPCVGCPVVKARKTGQPQEAEMTTSDGRVWFIRGYPVSDTEGNFTGAVEVTLEITERKQAEEEIERLASFPKLNPMPIVEVDQKGQLTYTNPAAQQIFRDLDKRQGKHPFLVGLKPFFSELQKTKRKYLFREVEVGSSWYSQIISLADPEHIRIYGADITERKLLEETLRESEEKYRELINGMNDTAWVIDFDGKFIDVNDAAVEVLGYSREELLTMGPHDIDSSLDAKKITGLIKGMQTDKLQVFETTHTSKDGKTIPVEIKSSLVMYQGEQAILSIARDITERKVMEEELRKGEERFRSVVETMKVGLGAIDENGVLTYVNEYFSKMLGYTIDEMIGRSTLDFYYDEESRKTQEEIFAKRREGMRDPTPYEVTWRKKDGLKVYSILSPSPSFDADGRFIGSFAIHTDITERKQTEEALQRSYEQLQETLITTVNALTSMVEMKDRYTAGHQPRVAQLACALAEAMGLSEEQIEGIRMAGFVHDIGKINIPAEILSKPGQLTEIQYDMVKMHPQASYEILKGIKFPWAVAEIALQHHERMDGSGYPQGLSGKEILLEARILAVANVVEAMTSHRPYRPAHDIKEALQEISQKKDVFYDPDVVDACLKLFTEKRFSFD